MPRTALAKKIEEVIDRLDEDGEFIDEIKTALNIDKTVKGFCEEKKVRMALQNLVLSVIKNMDSQDGDLLESVKDSIDIGKITKNLLKEDNDLKVHIAKVIKNRLLSGIDDDSLDDVVLEIIDENKPGIKKLFRNNGELHSIVHGKIVKRIKDFDINDNEDLSATIDDELCSQELIEKILKANQNEISDLLGQKVLTFIKKEFAAGNGDILELVEKMFENEEFLKKAAKTPLEKLLSNDNLEKIMERALEKILTSENSLLQSTLTEAVSKKLADKMATLAIDRLFSKKNNGAGAVEQISFEKQPQRGGKKTSAKWKI